ncbi:hypothetical protein GC175_17165 [bacterium]|nr:hypothetical protein [bacterium]
MPESKHTPAPWCAAPAKSLTGRVLRDYYWTVKAGDTTVADLFGEINKRSAKHPELEANARLIAAAPELLEACKWLLKDLSYKAPEQIAPEVAAHYTSRLTAIIAKAEGNQS